MKKHVLYGCGAILGVLATGLAGCASNPPRELVDARSAYKQAMNSQGASYAQTDLYDAKKSLDVAERKFKDDGDERETRDLAYVAQRKALSAQARAETYAALEQQKLAQAEIQRTKDMQAQQVARQAQHMEQQLSQMKNAFGQQQQMLDSERQARAAAEERTRTVLSQIHDVKTQEDQRGTVLTLSGGVLFGSGKTELMPMAQRKLDEVVDALKQDQRDITIVGHTDSTGSDQKNMELSQERADAVMRYLVTHGVPQDRVKAEGMGESQPIADNKSAEGRANNRRVEIILNKDTGGGMGSQGGQPQGMTNPGSSSGTDTAGTTSTTGGSMPSTTSSSTTTDETKKDKTTGATKRGAKTKAPKPADQGQ